MQIRDLYIQHGATLAPDNIPLHFGDLKAEYHAALDSAILLDRSHEGRLELSGKDRFELLNRISTNDLMNMKQGESRPTIFTNSNGRIIERAVVFNWTEDSLLLINGAGRGQFLEKYLRSQIFFNDDVQMSNLSASHYVFTLHGTKVDDIITHIANTQVNHGFHTTIAGTKTFFGQSKPYHGSHWIVIIPTEFAPAIWQELMKIGQQFGLHPAGGLTYNTLRIRSGIAGYGREITDEFIPLEVGLWDEVSFNKGCYKGQEIIARMDSRERVAKTIVRLDLNVMVQAPADIQVDGKVIGKLTSSVVSPEDEIFAIGVIKTTFANQGQQLNIEGNMASVIELLGTQPDWITF